MNKTILITGAGSDLGRKACQSASEKGYYVIAACRKPTTTVIPYADEVVGFDLALNGSRMAIPDGCWGILHIGALTQGGPAELMEVNAIGTLRLIEGAITKGVNKIIHVSTMSVYGEVDSPVVDARTPVNFPSPYGLSKFSAECYLRENFKSVPSVSIRCPAILGRSPSGNFLSQLAQAMLKRDSLIELSNPNFLFNNCVSSSALADFLVDLLIRDLSTYETFPVGTIEPLPLRQIVLLMRLLLDYDASVTWVNDGGKPFSIDIEAAIKLGYSPKTTRETLEIWLSDFLTQHKT